MTMKAEAPACHDVAPTDSQFRAPGPVEGAFRKQTPDPKNSQTAHATEQGNIRKGKSADLAVRNESVERELIRCGIGVFRSGDALRFKCRSVQMFSPAPLVPTLAAMTVAGDLAPPVNMSAIHASGGISRMRPRAVINLLHKAA